MLNFVYCVFLFIHFANDLSSLFASFERRGIDIRDFPFLWRLQPRFLYVAEREDLIFELTLLRRDRGSSPVISFRQREPHAASMCVSFFRVHLSFRPATAPKRSQEWLGTCCPSSQSSLERYGCGHTASVTLHPVPLLLLSSTTEKISTPNPSIQRTKMICIIPEYDGTILRTSFPSSKLLIRPNLLCCSFYSLFAVHYQRV